MKKLLSWSVGVLGVVGLVAVWAVSLAGPAAGRPVTPPSVVHAIAIGKSSTKLHPGARLVLPTTYRHHRIIRYQWYRCNKGGQRCTKIRGATHRSYTVRKADLGHVIRATVGTKTGQAITSPTQVVSPAAPVNTVRPTLSDNCASGASGCLADPTTASSVVTPGDVLTGTNGTWNHAAQASFTYQWFDCPSGTASPPTGCTAIPSATSLTYTVQDSDVNDTLVLQVTATVN